MAKKPKKAKKPAKPERSPGVPAKHLKIEGDWEDAVAHALKKPVGRPLTLIWRGETVGVDLIGNTWMLERTGRLQNGPGVVKAEPWPQTAERIRTWLDVHFTD